MRKVTRKRIIDNNGSTVAYLTGRRAELTKQGAKWWDRSISRHEVREPIFELATRLGHALEVTYNGRSVSTIYPHAQHAGNPNFHAGMRDAKRSKARSKSSRDAAYEVVDKNGNLLATSPNFGRALSKANDYAESSRLRPVTVKQGQKTVATSWGYQKERLSRDASPRCRVGTEVQSVILDNQFFSRAQAKSWIERHGFQAKKIDTTDDSFRFRQHEPSAFAGGSFRTITLRPGVKAVIGCPR